MSDQHPTCADCGATLPTDSGVEADDLDVECSECGAPQAGDAETVEAIDRTMGCCHCEAEAVERTCEDCGCTALVIDCGHHAQPAAISADEHGRSLCDVCHSARVEAAEAEEAAEAATAEAREAATELDDELPAEGPSGLIARAEGNEVLLADDFASVKLTIAQARALAETLAAMRGDDPRFCSQWIWEAIAAEERRQAPRVDPVTPRPLRAAATAEELATMARIENDYYRTPDAAADAIFVGMPSIVLNSLIYSRGCVDPCAGDGAIIDAAQRFGIRMWGYDIAPKRPDIMQRDALASAHWSTTPIGIECPSATIMNPPFRHAAAFVRRALAETPYFVAALLRLTFLEPCRDRIDLLEQHPNVLVLRHRPRFRADSAGSDSVTCAWLTWPAWSIAEEPQRPRQ